jgi:RNA polymerase-binding protein DksA
MLVLDLREIQQSLESQKEVLLNRLHSQEITNESGEIINPDRSDLAGQYRKQNRDKLLLARAGQQLADIERALDRLADGGYGKCTQCGDAIPPERLQVMPAAALCIDCQQQQEKISKKRRK